MNCTPETLRLYAVTDRAWTGRRTLEEQVACALQGGVTCVQLREKSLDAAAILAQANVLRALCRAFHVPFIVNDSVEIALACDADGVHIGQKDGDVRAVRAAIGPGRLLGVSAQTVEQARAAARDGADYLGVGAVFPTATKADAAEVSHETLRAVCRAVPIPAVAIGGITRDNLPQLNGCGAAGVAVVSAVFAAPDITAACRELRTLAEQMAGGTA